MPTIDSTTANYLEGFDADNPDPRPGPYYVSAVYGNRYALALGPFDTHAEALRLVRPVRELVAEHGGPREQFAGFGTCRLTLEPEDDAPAGAINSRPDLLEELAAHDLASELVSAILEVGR